MTPVEVIAAGVLIALALALVRTLDRCIRAEADQRFEDLGRARLPDREVIDLHRRLADEAEQRLNQQTAQFDVLQGRKA